MKKHKNLGVKTHGKRNNSAYRIWAAMRNRCNNPRNERYFSYGGRGIKVCEQWFHFEQFLKDMGERPSVEHSIDRIDNDKDYSPENCRWATRQQQQRNKRNNRLIHYRGETKCVAEWASVVEIKAKTIRNRLDSGWSAERALTTPVRKKRPPSA